MNWNGIVVSGTGRAAQFLELDGIAAQIEALAGWRPFPGTLNLRVVPEARAAFFSRREQFQRIAHPSSPECSGYLAPVVLHLAGIRCDSVYVLLPEKSHYDDVLEIIAPVNLREALGMRDGDRVVVRRVEQL